MAGPGSLLDALLEIAPADSGPDPAAIERLRLHLCDTIAAIALGREEAGLPLLPPAADVTLLRFAAAVRGSEIDDFHPQACVTPGSVAIPAALVIGMRRDADDGRIATAMLAGYEAMARLGFAIRGADIVHQGLWPTGLAAPIAASLIAARLMALPDDSVAHALALAATRASAAYAQGDPGGRLLLFGASVLEGVRCARLAAAGLKGDPSQFERLLERCTGRGLDLGARRAPTFAGVELKPYCTSRQTLSAIEAALRCAAGRDPAAIDRIVVAVPPQHRAMVDRPRPSGGGAVASAQCQIACALLRPDTLFRRRRDAELVDPDILAMMGRIEIVGDEALGARYPALWAARVEIVFGAQRVSRLVERPREADPPSWDMLARKLARILPDSTATPLREAAQAFATPGRPDTAALLLRIAGDLLDPAGR